MTPSSMGLVLVEGNDVDGFTMDHDAVEIINSADATAAVLRSEALAATRGLRLKSIGLTWSDDADAEASMLMQSLSESGFDNVIPVRFPEANEAVARGIADALGCGTTAVCTIEPEFAITMIVHAASGAVHTAVNHSIGSRAGLTSWLSAVFTRADWQPEALVVIGSAGNFEAILPGLQDALSVPVFTPEEADLALARGAALVSVRSGDTGLSEPYYFGDVPRPDEWAGQDYGWDPTFDAFEDQFARPAAAPVAPAARHRSHSSSRWQQASSSPALPLTMLAVGSTAFVASVSMAVTLQFLPGHGTASVTKSPRPAAAEQSVAPAPPPVHVAPAAEPSAEVAVPVEAPLSDAPIVEPQAAPVVETVPTAPPEGIPAPEALPAATDIPPAEIPSNSVAVAVPAEAPAPPVPAPADAAPQAEPAAPPQ
ncbi:hypothetical protein [Mycobacterium sp. ST-F2]|uniref:DUF7159 family protein n=1 Tax=Mycobacterium sp. ST-F2 TaxID=1490484 RepID=UPI00257125AB|nr:hypothetical protein [Mycobacterium sp. ST-F2]